ncbi:MAG: gliding motility-associated C-terminal domain-containing protein [Saprospiraceae bacterium]|nr:gliding motility-associated C-terminal domain-containing protein [Saprospiraceae bacterium]
MLIQDDHGCIAIDDILIKVNTAPGVFVPNVFSPNGDRLNDFLKFNTGLDIQKIVKFSVFDRWGELVYFNSDFDANLDDYGWDGKFEGQDMNPGVLFARLRHSL